MKIDWEGVIKGSINSIFIKEEVEKVAKERLAICATCDYDSNVRRAKGVNFARLDHFCAACGCCLKLKTRYMAANCGMEKYNEQFKTNEPLKWFAQTDQVTGNIVDDIVEGKNK